MMEKHIDEKIFGYLIRGDLHAAMDYMKSVPEYSEKYAEYKSLYEDECYISYNVPDYQNGILLLYQKYFRSIFYLKADEKEAENALFNGLRSYFGIPEADEDNLRDAMGKAFGEIGCNVLCGRTSGYFGPYVWKSTEPVTYEVEIPDGTRSFTVNILRGFIFRSWLDYLTFGEMGTGGWTNGDGIINCIEKEYDFESENFRVSLLKHEAQHACDLERWPEMSSTDLEYRAKLTELIYTEKKRNLLRKFISEADESKAGNGHALASARIASEFAGYDSPANSEIKKRAKSLFSTSTSEMTEKYG